MTIYKRIINNTFIKIISVILAFIAWLILVNISDPTTNITVSGVNVRFENEASLTEKGYTYEVLDGSKISVDLSGPKSEITSITASDIDAIVDLAEMSPFSDYADINVAVVKDGEIIKNINATPKTSSVKLNISNRSSADFQIEPDITGDESNGFVVSDVSITPSSVRIVGPSDLLSSVKSVKIKYDVSDTDSDILVDCGIKIYNKEGEEIDNGSLDLSRNTVKLSARVLIEKEVKIKYETQGEPADGYSVREINLSADTVKISGSENAIKDVKEINIPSSAIDISDISSNKTYRIWLSDYLPSGVNVESNNSIEVNVITDKNK